jgi:hypothetical protein
VAAVVARRRRRARNETTQIGDREHLEHTIHETGVCRQERNGVLAYPRYKRKTNQASPGSVVLCFHITTKSDNNVTHTNTHLNHAAAESANIVILVLVPL